jgi:phosphatidate cytidylyltransferase
VSAVGEELNFMSAHLKQRLLLGGLATLIVLLAIYFSHTPVFEPIFVFLNVTFISLAVWEYYKLVQLKGDRPLMAIGISCSVAYIISAYLGQIYPEWHFLPPLTLFITLIVSFLAFFNQQTNPLNNLAVTLFGLAYLAIPLSFMLKINYMNFGNEDGRLWLVYLLVLTKMTDTGAYFVGKKWGKHKLAPHISPKKTVEGSIGGLVATMAISLLFYLVPQTANILKITWMQSIGIGFSISLLAQLGDLAESILKRDAGVKDSSYLPAFGGILDIADSLIFTLPFMYFILKMKFIHP